MHYVVVINSIHRSLDLVVRSLSAALEQIDKKGVLLFLDQNKQKLALPQQIANNPLLIHQHYQVQSVSQSRNFLLKWAELDKYEWVIFCDDDGYFANDYISKFEFILKKHPNVEAVAGSIKIHSSNMFYSPRHAIGGTLKNLLHYKLLMGSNFAVKAQIFKKLQGFDERFGAGAYWGSGEESDFSLKLFFSNANMEYFKDLIVYHEAPRSGALEQECLKAYKYGLGKGALVKKWIFDEKKPHLFFEFLEMFVVPVGQLVVSLLMFQKKSKIFLNTIRGRFVGFIKAFRNL